MASPSFHNPSNSNYESLFVSPSPDPQLPPLDSSRSPQHHQQQQQWERPSAPPRNPSFTLPRPVPSLQRQNSQNHPQPDPTLYQNHYFQQRSSGGQAGSSRQQGGQAQAHPTNYPQQNQQAYESYQQPQHSYYDLNQQIEPQLPSPSAAGATNGNLTPSRFELENGENYLTSTPEGGWNFDAFLDPEYSDGLGLVPTGSQNSNSNNHNSNNSQNNNLIQEPDLFHPTWNNGADPFAPPDTPPILHINRRREPREQPRDPSRQPRYGVVDEDRERRRRLLMHREEVLDLTHTSPTMSPRGTKRSAPGAEASGTRGNVNASPPLEGPVAGGNDISPPPAKRAKTSTSTSTSKPSASDDTLRDLFGSPGKEDEVDLVGVNDDTSYEDAAKKRKEEEVAKARKAEQEKPVKLAQQQCVICLDQPDGLTVTHCGHMFCAECLHGALNTSMMGKKVCPVCRSTINTNNNKKGEMARSGIFHMEMKLQTRKKGKQAQRI